MCNLFSLLRCTQKLPTTLMCTPHCPRLPSGESGTNAACVPFVSFPFRPPLFWPERRSAPCLCLRLAAIPVGMHILVDGGGLVELSLEYVVSTRPLPILKRLGRLAPWVAMTHTPSLFRLRLRLGGKVHWVRAWRRVCLRLLLFNRRR